MKTQRIVFYEPLTYQLLGVDADIGTYHEFLSAFDDLARGQSFEKVHVDIPTMLQWPRDNGHKNNDAGRAVFSETLQAIHPDVDHVPKQTFAAANFGSPFGPMGLGGDPRNPWGRGGIDWATMPRSTIWR